jgi:hypothetical protein
VGVCIDSLSVDGSLASPLYQTRHYSYAMGFYLQERMHRKRLAVILTQLWRDRRLPLGCTSTQIQLNKNPALAFDLARCFGAKTNADAFSSNYVSER